jgi:hypothetical protein
VTELRTVAPRVEHRLLAALRFRDAFHDPLIATTPPIRTALEVSLPALGLVALYADSDATYRFPIPPRLAVAPGNYAVDVVSTDGLYVNHGAIEIALPRTVSTPARASDFLETFALWPTRRFPLPADETAVIGRIQGAGTIAGLKVRLYCGAGPVPAQPFTYTDDRGEFVFRMLRPGCPTTGDPDVHVVVNEGATAVAISPATIQVGLGRRQYVQLTRS